MTERKQAKVKTKVRVVRMEAEGPDGAALADVVVGMVREFFADEAKPAPQSSEG